MLCTTFLVHNLLSRLHIPCRQTLTTFRCSSTRKKGCFQLIPTQTISTWVNKFHELWPLITGLGRRGTTCNTVHYVQATSFYAQGCTLIITLKTWSWKGPQKMAHFIKLSAWHKTCFSSTGVCISTVCFTMTLQSAPLRDRKVSLWKAIPWHSKPSSRYHGLSEKEKMMTGLQIFRGFRNQQSSLYQHIHCSSFMLRPHSLTRENSLFIKCHDTQVERQNLML